MTNSITQQCIEFFKKEETKREFYNIVWPLVIMIIYEMRYYIYFLVTFVTITFLMILTILVILIQIIRNKNIL